VGIQRPTDISGDSSDRRVTDNAGRPSNGQEPWSGVVSGETEHFLKSIETNYPGIPRRSVARTPGTGQGWQGHLPLHAIARVRHRK
jgi:hypothetical protein